ncbi:MAG TPA: hypothetical protein VFL93_05030 [Longimicrobiaceae bacterium]|nr:hypothetical protein [Longimicrobiaceae bacterium]
MSVELLSAGVVLALVLGLRAITLYVQHLPEAPLCPCCRAVTREIACDVIWLRLLPTFTATSYSECGRCGWSGRMRWRWAADSPRHGG